VTRKPPRGRGDEEETLDLNGHTISTQAPVNTGTTGVDNEAGYDHVTIKDGAIMGFRFPVRIARYGRGGAPGYAGAQFSYGQDDRAISAKSKRLVR
jgi:hypothetical protein